MFTDDLHDDSVSLDARSQYMRQLRWTSKLDYKEEARLLQRIVHGKHERIAHVPNQCALVEARQARDELIERMQFFVFAIARQYLHRFHSMDLLDLVQEANIGLMQALEQFDESCKHSFQTLAGQCIRNAIRKAHRDRDAIMRISPRVYDTLSERRRVERELLVTLGREPSVAEIAEAMSLSEEKLADLIFFGERKVESLQGLFVEDQREDTLDVAGLYGYSDSTDTARQDELVVHVQQALETLPPRQRDVIRLRYGFDGQSLTHKDIEATFGMGRHVSSSYENRAKKRLQQELVSVLGFEEEEVA